MNKRRFLIEAILIGIASLMLILILSHCSKKEKEELTFPSTVLVYNHTQYTDIDQLVKITLNKIYNVDTVMINVFKMSKPIKSAEIEIYAYIQKPSTSISDSIYQNRKYSIFLAKDIPEDVKKIVVHELIHLYQMYRGDLMQVDGTHVFYQGKKIVFKEVEYNDRPYEIEAFLNQASVLKEANDILYK